jgi:NAD(P)-dependent dehydrogenase (short-subunit alcohol dehydrogenase family)
LCKQIYRVSKAVLVHLTRILGVELREHGGRVGDAAPGHRSDRAHLRRLTRSRRRRHDTTDLPRH